MTALKSFCEAVEFENLKKKIEQAIPLIYYHCKATGETEITMPQVEELFKAAGLAAPNFSRLKKDFTRSPHVNRGSSSSTFRLTRAKEKELDKKYAHLFEPTQVITVEERADLTKAPLLAADDIEVARKMAKLYVITHCYENSVRKVIEKVLSDKLGTDWWDQVANTSMKRKLSDRQDKEKRNKWISPRGQSELFYMDWGDLLFLIRKYEADFNTLLPDYKFVELRFEELEGLRNVVAHHGTFNSDDEIDQIVLSFKQWCRQLS